MTEDAGRGRVTEDAGSGERTAPSLLLVLTAWTLLTAPNTEPVTLALASTSRCLSAFRRTPLAVGSQQVALPPGDKRVGTAAGLSRGTGDRGEAGTRAGTPGAARGSGKASTSGTAQGVLLGKEGRAGPPSPPLFTGGGGCVAAPSSARRDRGAPEGAAGRGRQARRGPAARGGNAWPATPPAGRRGRCRSVQGLEGWHWPRSPACRSHAGTSE